MYYWRGQQSRKRTTNVPLPASSASSVIITEIQPDSTKSGAFCHLSGLTKVLISGILRHLFKSFVPASVAAAEWRRQARPLDCVAPVRLLLSKEARRCRFHASMASLAAIPVDKKIIKVIVEALASYILHDTKPH